MSAPLSNTTARAERAVSRASGMQQEAVCIHSLASTQKTATLARVLARIYIHACIHTCVRAYKVVGYRLHILPHTRAHTCTQRRYFAMFSGMGWETVTGCRQYFYIRHIDWAITCPLIIFSLGILATQDLATILAGETEFVRVPIHPRF